MTITAVAASAAPTGKMGPLNASPPGHRVAPDAPFLVQGKQVYLQSYKGHKLMVWQVTTWCPSCRAGLQVMAENKALIDKSDLRVLVLEDYKNGGYAGDSMETFVRKSAPALLNDPHFIIGEDTETLFRLYNPHHYIDVYQLITANGHIAVVSSAPSASFDKIKNFVTSAASP
ncbi:MAG: oxidoreductase [Acetobacteraceae bacterium]